MAKSLKSPVLGTIDCSECGAQTNVKRRKLGRGGRTQQYFSYCPSCNHMEQKGDEQTQSRLKAFMPLIVAEVPEKTNLENPIIGPKATELGDFVGDSEVSENPVFTNPKPLLKTPIENPKKPRKFWLAAGLLSLGGALIAIARV